MVELNKIQFLLFVLLMIFPAHALDVIFSRADEDFKQKAEINTDNENGEKKYVGTSYPLTYQPKSDTSKVIVYIIDRSRLVEIIRKAVRETRLQIAQQLSESHCELVFLGIANFDDDEYHLIGAFMVDKIQSDQNKTKLTIETIGENHFNHSYRSDGLDIEKYQENAQICEGALITRLRSIPCGYLKPVDDIGKEIKLYGFHPHTREVSWPVNVVNNKYSPAVNITDPRYNFRLRYRTKKICLLILGGKEYTSVTSYGNRWAKRNEMPHILDKMTRHNEGLFILGAFNFDWTELDIVAQIILKHSEGWQGFQYNVFTYGFGIFNTIYRNVYEGDKRIIQRQPKANVTDMIARLMEEEAKERAIKMYYSNYGWKNFEMPIELRNGRYLPAKRFQNYSFPWVDQKIAFIVCDSTEVNDPIDISMVYQSVGELKQSGICVVVIEAINFGLDDMHNIAQWIDCHRGNISSEQIAVLGSGIFDTIFQSESTTYNTFLDTKKNELEKIRYAYVKKCDGKRMFAVRIDDLDFEVRTDKMNTVNGFYEPDLIPDKNMFDNTDRKDIFFIITSANRFQQISTMQNLKPVTPSLRGGIRRQYPLPEWKVFLVGLDNFEERDYHLFAELVKIQTNDERSMQEFVCVYNYDIGIPLYQYKDTAPIPFDTRPRIQSQTSYFFELIRKLADGTLFPDNDD